MAVPVGCVRVARREVGLRSHTAGLAPTTGCSNGGQGRHAPSWLTRQPRITLNEVGARNRYARLPVLE
jgi:hypothetical protein